MTYDTKGIWRCYEIKSSKADFYSRAAHTFIGHFNYYVLTPELFELVKDEIPSHIGVFVGGTCVKNPKKQELGLDEGKLKEYMIRSLTRYFQNTIDSEDDRLIAKKDRQIGRLKSERNTYKKKYNKIQQEVYDKHGEWYD